MSVKELLGFVNDKNAKVRNTALEHLLGLSATKDGKRMLTAEKAAASLVRLIGSIDEETHVTTVKCLINMSDDGSTLKSLLQHKTVSRLMDSILEANENTLLNYNFMLLSNITRDELGVIKLLQVDGALEGYFLRQILVRFVSKLEHITGLGHVLVNATQHPIARKILLQDSKNELKQILNYMDAKYPAPCKLAAVSILRNCLFDVSNHDMLWKDEYNILAPLMMFFRGNDKFTDEELATMPEALRKVPETQEREPNVQVRKAALDCIHLLVATTSGRKRIETCGVYPLLRQYDLVEERDELRLGVLNIVQEIKSDFVPSKHSHPIIQPPSMNRVYDRDAELDENGEVIEEL